MRQSFNIMSTQTLCFRAKTTKVMVGLIFYFICTIQIHQKGNTELKSGMHYTNGIPKKSEDLFESVSLFVQ